jgi:hypothetical protein
VAANGRKTRGKYTFVTRFWFETTLALDNASAEAKYVQGSSPEKANT